MRQAYDAEILEWAMRNMGEMVEYWVEGCNGDPTRLFQILQISGIAKEWERGNTVFILGRSGTELCQLACERMGIKRDVWPRRLVRYDASYNYWMDGFLRIFSGVQGCRSKKS
ncbi:MAG: hypothetical protein II571_02100 [Lachnospiraceae bacterium]|nr:hypothetical protein [Lachnospiraceae bacterium]